MTGKKGRRRIVAGLVVGAVAFVGAILFPYTDKTELKTFDWRFALRGTVAQSAPPIIVSIDDASFIALKKRWPWPREFFARAIDIIAAGGARAIGLDVSLSDKGSSDQEDRAISEAMKRAGTVVVPVKFGELRTGEITQTYLDLPDAAFKGSYGGAGFVNMPLDPDGFVRRLKIAESFQGSRWFPFSLCVLARAEGKPLMESEGGEVMLGKRKIPGIKSGVALIDYAGPPGTFPSVSFAKVLEGTAPPGIFKDRIVLIGAGFQESHDQFPTPFFQGDDMYGVEIHANAINTFASGGGIKTMAEWQSLLLLLLVSAAAALLVVLRPLPGLGAAAALCALIVVAGVLLFTGLRLWMRMVEPLLAVVICYIGALLYRYLVEEREKREVRNLFSRFVGPTVVEQILLEGEGIALGGEIRELTIFFSDIRGFTPMSEKMSPGAVVQMLNEYFREMVEIIFQFGGTLNKFIGDAIMAIYGAPLAMPNAAEKAVRACLQMRETLAKLNSAKLAAGMEPIKIGMALHRGEVVVGNIGSPRQMEYTVIGDVVNTCSRLESLTKELKTDFIVSDEIYQSVQHLVTVESPPPVFVKGISAALQVHKVLGLKGA
jgi:adenylate cyclase